MDSFTFRQNFTAKLESGFLVPATTFDNVVGNFPIGFKIWNTENQEKFSSFDFDVYDAKANKLPSKYIFDYNGKKRINQWLKNFFEQSEEKAIAVMHHGRNDFQSVRGVYITLFLVVYFLFKT